MTTVRQIQRHWEAKSFRKLHNDLMAARPEASLRLEPDLQREIPVAALALVRLEELSQSYVPLYGQLVRRLLAAREADGGWGDPATTALCLRALLGGRGEGAAIEQGMAYLAAMQKPEGIWPHGPFRRMPCDPHVSAFVLSQLGDCHLFRSSTRFIEALNWFEAHESTLDPDTRRLWDRAQRRCRLSCRSPQLFGVN